MGGPPFPGNSEKEIFVNILQMECIKMPHFISTAATDFISKLLVDDPEQRMPLDDAKKHPWIRANPWVQHPWVQHCHFADEFPLPGEHDQ